MSVDRKQIEDLTAKYCNLLYFGDVDLIPVCFHDEASVSNLNGDEMIAIDMAGFHERIRNRQSPASIDEPRNDIVHLIDQFSPTTAMVKVEISILDDRFYDYLTLMKRAGTWKIISKVFHRSPGDGGK